MSAPPSGWEEAVATIDSDLGKEEETKVSSSGGGWKVNKSQPKSDDVALYKPPLTPRKPPSSSKLLAAEDDKDVYVRADGKKVRRVRKTGTAASAGSLASDEDIASNGTPEIYVRPDGKKVRRVKRKKKKSDKQAPQQQQQQQQEQPLAPTPTKRDIFASTQSLATTPSDEKLGTISPVGGKSEAAYSRTEFSVKHLATMPSDERTDRDESLLVGTMGVLSTVESEPGDIPLSIEFKPAPVSAVLKATRQNVEALSQKKEPTSVETPEPTEQVKTLDELKAEKETPREVEPDGKEAAVRHNPFEAPVVPQNPFEAAADQETQNPTEPETPQPPKTTSNAAPQPQQPPGIPMEQSASSSAEPLQEIPSGIGQARSSMVASDPSNDSLKKQLTPPEPVQEQPRNKKRSQEGHAEYDDIAAIAGAANSALMSSTSSQPSKPAQSEKKAPMPSIDVPTPRVSRNANAPAHPPEASARHGPSSSRRKDKHKDELWQDASMNDTVPEPKHQNKHLPESIMVRTRSRADVEAPSTELVQKGPPQIIDLSNDPDRFVRNTTVARKRVRVVQLLMFGLLGIVLGFLGSFYVQSTCNFGSAEVTVGQNQEPFELHFGLWKYSPIDSAFEGYSYCSKYDENYTNDAPHLARLFAGLALLAGSFSLFVLWFYLIFGIATQNSWVAAVRVCALAGIFQALTLLFFRGDVCLRNTCALGPGAIVSIVSAAMWFVLGFELHYNMPMSAMIQGLSNRHHVGANMMANLEMSDFQKGAEAYIHRIDTDTKEYIPSLNQMRRNRERNGDDGISLPRSTGSYRPPTMFDL